MIRSPIQPALRLGLGFLSLAILLGGYTWLSYRQHRINPKDTTIPTWNQMASGISDVIKPHGKRGERWLVIDVKATGWRFVLGMGIGVVGAVILGMLMGCFGALEAFVDPPLSLLAKIPPTAVLAVFFVLIGTDTKMFAAIIAFGVLPTLAMVIHLEVKGFPQELLSKAYTLGARVTDVVWHIIFRHTLPRVIDGIRLMIGPALVFLIAAEVYMSDAGFGYRIRLQSQLLKMNIVYPYLALLAIFGFAADFTLRRLKIWLCPWHQSKIS